MPASRSFGTQRISDGLGTFSYLGLLLIIAWVPLPFGSARPWAAGLLATLVGLLAIARGTSDFMGEISEEAHPRGVIVAGLLFAGALGWALFQSLPWAPEAWTHPLWREAAPLLPSHPPHSRISIDPSASQTEVLHLLSYAAIFWVAFRCCRDTRRGRSLVRAVAILGAAYAGWGLFVYWSGNHNVLWFDKWTYRDDLTSTFVNRNSFATFCGLVALAALGLLLDTLLREVDLKQTRRAVLYSLVEFLSTRLTWLVGTLLVTATALLLTHSRGGAAAAAGGVIALLGAVLLAPGLRGNRRLSVVLTAGIGLAGCLVLLISGTETLMRVADTSFEMDGRHEIYEFTLRALAERPILGTGLGTFKTVFQTYRTENLQFVTELAHDDYLENLLELGIPAGLALFSSILALFLVCAKGVLRRRRDEIFPCIGIGATVLVAVHSLVDFSLQIPAVTTYFLVLLGAGVAQSFSTSARAS
jgi:O-antigen ligase